MTKDMKELLDLVGNPEKGVLLVRRGLKVAQVTKGKQGPKDILAIMDLRARKVPKEIWVKMAPKARRGLKVRTDPQERKARKVTLDPKDLQARKGLKAPAEHLEAKDLLGTAVQRALLAILALVEGKVQ